jgi:hypothetical protein
VGALTAFAFVLLIGDAQRFHCGKRVARYQGLVPLESPVETAAWTKHGKGRDGTQAGGSFVLDVASGLELPAVAKVRFARGESPEIAMVRSRTPRY